MVVLEDSKHWLQYAAYIPTELPKILEIDLPLYSLYRNSKPV
jgi:hypothetical protein